MPEPGHPTVIEDSFPFSAVELALFYCILQSSLAAARADNFYYPPEWTPKQVFLHSTSALYSYECNFELHECSRFLTSRLFFQGNLNKFHGQHALRERARKIDQGILIIRY